MPLKYPPLFREQRFSEALLFSGVKCSIVTLSLSRLIAFLPVL